MLRDRRPHILVAEDDEDWRERISRYLAEEGYKVSLAKNYEEVIAMINNHKIDLMCLDVILYKGEGKAGFMLEFTALLYQAVEKKIPVIIITWIKEKDLIFQAANEYNASVFFKYEIIAKKLLLKIEEKLSANR